MKNALGKLLVALLFGATWPLRELTTAQRNLTTVVLVVVLLAAQYMAVAGLATLLQPLWRMLLDLLWPRKKALQVPSRSSAPAA